ncbi:hypothetical protein [Anatilimnocola floriformis]|uniref:hypothetical protein n=1 Tax=Anatilimnocola floriformis TaxID=2948575 RepID=UPI0020C43AA0|nr:hypothetical protein [Anatilimnocola floriformis]
MDPFAEQLGFTPAWFAAGVVNDEILARIKTVWEESDDRNTEHYRWGAFCDFVKSRPTLTPELANELYSLGNNDPNPSMGGCLMARVLGMPGSPRSLIDAARKSNRPHVAKIAERLRLYYYVGPADLARLATAESPRQSLGSAASALQLWRQYFPSFKPGRHNAGSADSLTVTFVVQGAAILVADRHSEHIACARGEPVNSAGELTLALNKHGQPLVITEISNQSTGFCPEPASWFAVQHALQSTGIQHPQNFTNALIFRRCPSCRATNVVKDHWLHCEVCGAELPAEWNFAD